MIKTHPEKNKKIPNLKMHSIERNACAMTNVQSKLTHTAILCPADRVSRGKISLGISQLRGPHDHANADTKMHTITTTNTAKPFDRSSSWSLTFIPIITAITN